MAVFLFYFFSFGCLSLMIISIRKNDEGKDGNRCDKEGEEEVEVHLN